MLTAPVYAVSKNLNLVSSPEEREDGIDFNAKRWPHPSNIYGISTTCQSLFGTEGTRVKETPRAPTLLLLTFG